MLLCSGSPTHPPYMFLSQFLSQTTVNPLWLTPPPPLLILYSVPIKKIEILAGASLLHQYLFHVHFLLKKDRNTLWGLPRPPIHIPCSIRIQNWCKSSLKPPASPSTYSLFSSYSKLKKMLYEASLLHQYISLIQFIFKGYENVLWSIPPPPVYYVLEFKLWRSSLHHGNILRTRLGPRERGPLG